MNKKILMVLKKFNGLKQMQKRTDNAALKRSRLHWGKRSRLQ